MNKKISEAVSFLPAEIKEYFLNIPDKISENVTDIRLKANAPIMIYLKNDFFFLKRNGSLSKILQDENNIILSKEQINDISNKLFDYSLHTYQNELKKGYKTVSGGHRVGISASAVLNENGEIKTVKDISSLNIRIARDIKNVSDEFTDKFYKNGIKSTLIIGEPSSGKTTFIRDICRNLSSEKFGFKRVCLVDEREEIAAVTNGISGNDLGISCDILSGYPKEIAMINALKTLSAEVIISDEIATDADICAIEKSANSGVKIISSMHADSFCELKNRKQFIKLFQKNIFEYFVLLKGRSSPSCISKIYNSDEELLYDSD